MRPPKCHWLASHTTLQRRVVSAVSKLPVATTRRCSVRVVGDLSAKGRPILPKSVTVERIMGEGSFGQVFGGFLNTPTGNQRVVLKRVKTRVQGAEEMSQMEHLLNVYASRVARGHCADFLGYCEVADSEATGRLTSGLWLVWKYEGSKTLSYYLRRRDTVRALATDLEVSEQVVVQTVMRQIFESLAAFHAAGLVHRDVKPLNMILAEDVRRFKLIDLGACADLRTGTNYVPEESILDPNFCPPEQFVMPTDSPHISKQAGLFKLAISPMLWAKHKPDRFDTWSAGIVMLQLAVPAMRTDRALRNFNAAYGPKYKYDLAAWRKGVHLSSRDCALLDVDDDAGWDLLQSLLAPRHIQVDEKGGVNFVNDTPFQRISAFEALKHRYIKTALEAVSPAAAATSTSGSSAAAAASRGSAAAADSGAARVRRGKLSGDAAAAAEANNKASRGGSTSTSSSGSGNMDPLGSALDVWKDMTGRLFDLEARIMRQTSATELQTTTVRRLKEQVDSGRVDPAVLQKEEKVLSKMQSRLAGLQEDFSATASQASGIFSFFGFGNSKQQQQQQQQQEQQQQQQRRQQEQQPQLGASPRSGQGRAQNQRALRDAEAASAVAASSSPSSSAPSAVGMFNSVWERLSSRLAELERKISNQASATERQSLVVRGLRAKVKAGEVEPETLAKAERTLSRMERRLLDLDRDYWSARQSANGALAGNMPTDTGGRQRPGSREQLGVVGPTTSSIQSRDSDMDGASGSFWSRLLGSRSGSSMDGSTKDAPLQQAAQAPPPPPSPPPPSQEPPLQRALSPFFRRTAPPNPSAAAPPPPPSLPPQQQKQQEQRPADAGYRSIFGPLSALTSGSSSSGRRAAAQSSVDNPPPFPPPPPTQRATSPMRSTSPRGGGGFFGLFGRSRQQELDALAPPPLPPSPSPQSALSSSSSTTSSGAVTSSLPVPLPAAPTNASGGDALVEGASRVIRNSLSFTGLAARIAGDLATAFKADAERYLKELEMQEAAKRQQRTLDLAFLALLREAQPPVLSTDSFEEAEGRFADEVRWAALADGARRRDLFEKYLITAKKVEEQAAAAADAAFRAALRRYNVSAASQWTEVRNSLPESDPAVAGVQDTNRRQQLFLEVVAELQLQAALRAASLKAETEFTGLLAALRDPPVTSTSTWALVRKAVAGDPRCQALPERRRRELFEAFTARLLEQDAQRSKVVVVAAKVEELAEVADALASASTATLITSTTATTAVPAPTPTSPPILASSATLSPPGHQHQHQHQEQEHEHEALQEAAAVQDVIVAASAVAGPEATRPISVSPGTVPAVVGLTSTLPLAPGTATAAAAVSSAPTSAETSAITGVAADSPSSFPVQLVDDDDLSAALAGMEAALETALKAVSSAPLPSTYTTLSSGASSIRSSSRNLPSVTPPPLPPVQRSGGSTAHVNGVTRSRSPSASPGAGPDGGQVPPAEGLRLEELRREQARLRAEYEAMAHRLREMEERLKGQAQLMSLPDVEPSDNNNIIRNNNNMKIINKELSGAGAVEGDMDSSGGSNGSNAGGSGRAASNDLDENMASAGGQRLRR